MSMSELEITQGERNFYEYMIGNADKFYDSLFHAILLATAKQKKELAKAFPEEVACVGYYQNVEGYWVEIKSRIESGK